jgi:hypothetical protein
MKSSENLSVEQENNPLEAALIDAKKIIDDLPRRAHEIGSHMMDQLYGKRPKLGLAVEREESDKKQIEDRAFDKTVDLFSELTGVVHDIRGALTNESLSEEERDRYAELEKSLDVIDQAVEDYHKFSKGPERGERPDSEDRIDHIKQILGTVGKDVSFAIGKLLEKQKQSE